LSQIDPWLSAHRAAPFRLPSRPRNGRAVRRDYDRLGRPTQERWYANEADARASTTLNILTAHSAYLDFVYDALGRLEEQRQVRRQWNGGQWTFADRATDSYRYDGLDRLTNDVRPLPTTC
jgi:hypothetical protein